MARSKMLLLLHDMRKMCLLGLCLLILVAPPVGFATISYLLIRGEPVPNRPGYDVFIPLEKAVPVAMNCDLVNSLSGAFLTAKSVASGSERIVIIISAAGKIVDGYEAYLEGNLVKWQTSDLRFMLDRSDGRLTILVSMEGRFIGLENRVCRTRPLGLS
jgi:hypothetical protein